MKLLYCLALSLSIGQGQPHLLNPPDTHRHWCDQPVRKLCWLNQKIQNAQSWSPYHYGWEVHQARQREQEVFVLHLCRYCGSSRGFLLYNHHGELIGRGNSGLHTSPPL